MLARILLGLSLTLGVACTKKVTFEESRWSGEGERPLPSQEYLVSASEWTMGSEKIEFSEQVVGKFVIENSFLKTISKGDKIVFQSFALVDHIPSWVVAEAEALDLVKMKSWGQFLEKNPDYQDWKLDSPPQVKISLTDKLTALLMVRLVNKSGEFFEVQFSKNGNLLKEVRLGSNLADLTEVSALAYPKGPKKSELSKIILKRLNVPEGLANHQLEIKTESPDRKSVV